MKRLALLPLLLALTGCADFAEGLHQAIQAMPPPQGYSSNQRQSPGAIQIGWTADHAQYVAGAADFVNPAGYWVYARCGQEYDIYFQGNVVSAVVVRQSTVIDLRPCR